MKHRLFTLHFSLLICLAAMAQLDNTVEVTNEVKPVATDAKKVDVPTQAADTKVTHHTMQYAVDSQPLSDYAPESLGDYETEEVWKGKKPGYIHLGGGTQGRVDAQAAYRFQLGERDALTADFTLAGFNGRAKDNGFWGVNGWKSRDYQNRAALDFRHHLGSGSDFFVKADFGNRLFNYMADGSATDKQHDVTASVLLGFEPLQMGSLSLDAQAGVDFFSQNYRTTLEKCLGETYVHADASADYELSDAHSVGLGLAFAHTAYGNSELKGTTALRFTPHYLYSGELLDFQLGLFASTLGHVAPDVSLTYHLDSKNDLWLELTGEEEDNTCRLLSDMHPYFAFFSENEPFKVSPAFYDLEASMGWRFKDFHGLGGNLALGYEQGKNTPSLEWLDSDNGGRAVALTEWDTYRACTFDADFTYAYEDAFKLDARNRLYLERWKDEETGDWKRGNYALPTFSMDWRADVRILKGLHAGLGWQFRVYHQEDLGTPDEPQYKRPVTANLSADLRYMLPMRQPLTLFLHGDNLLHRSFDRYYAYRAPGATLLGGLALSF